VAALAPTRSGHVSARSHVAKWVALGIVSLSTVPAVWFVSLYGFGSKAAAARVSDTAGVWIFSWGLAAMAWIGAMIVGGICVASAIAAYRDASERPSDDRRPANSASSARL
jgi:hypothetical protein